MTATKRLSEVTHQPGWQLRVDGEAVSGDWEAVSRFGSVETAVVCDAEGKPIFDRPLYRESPNVNIIAFGFDGDGEVRLAIIRQPRPHADLPEPERRAERGHEPVVFGQIPMGFVKTIVGESIEQAADREAADEVGTRVVKRVVYPQCPWHNPNPTFVATWSDLVFLEVDLGFIAAHQSTRNEPIFSAEFITAAELLQRVEDGRDAAGAVYRMCTANSALLIFFATFPQFWPRP